MASSPLPPLVDPPSASTVTADGARVAALSASALVISLTPLVSMAKVTLDQMLVNSEQHVAELGAEVFLPL